MLSVTGGAESAQPCLHAVRAQGSSVRPALPSLLGGEDLQFEAGSIMSARGRKHASLRAAWQPMFFSARRALAAGPRCSCRVGVEIRAALSRVPHLWQPLPPSPGAP